MDIVFTVLILLLAVAASGIVTRMMRVALPLPLVQIAIGAMLAWPRLGLHVSFDPEIFMMLFIPPLLFADGWRIPKRELFMARRSILMLALGLVFMTVLAVGYFIHALVPSISLPVAFALAAVLSPTDAVALSGIVGKGKIPGRLMHILEGEALMNDASGLVALKFAIAAALTGVFSLRDASISFVIIAVGGLATGAAVSWLFSFVSAHFLSLNEEGDPAPGVVMTLLIPFAAYLIAERFEFSGILAAVSAGMMMNYANIANAGSVSSRVRGNSTWTMIEFVFNGMVSAVPGLRTATVTTVAGVRGAVTLAGVLSLPEVLPGGTPLPGRDLAIFIASGVILLSLLVAVVALPLLLSGWRRGKDPHAAEEAMARTMAAQAAIRAVDEVHDRDCADLDESASAYAADVTARVMDIYRRRLATLEDEQEPRELARRADALEFRMKLAAMRAERKVLLALRNSQAINDETLNKLMREVDLSETALTVRKR